MLTEQEYEIGMAETHRKWLRKGQNKHGRCRRFQITLVQFLPNKTIRYEGETARQIFFSVYGSGAEEELGEESEMRTTNLREQQTRTWNGKTQTKKVNFEASMRWRSPSSGGPQNDRRRL